MGMALSRRLIVQYLHFHINRDCCRLRITYHVTMVTMWSCVALTYCEVITPKSVPDTVKPFLVDRNIRSHDRESCLKSKLWKLYIDAHLYQGLLSCLSSSPQHNTDVWRCFVECSQSCDTMNSLVKSGCHFMVPFKTDHLWEHFLKEDAVLSPHVEQQVTTMGRLDITSACTTLSTPQLFQGPNLDKKTSRMTVSIGFDTHPALRINVTFLLIHLHQKENAFFINGNRNCKLHFPCVLVWSTGSFLFLALHGSTKRT